MGMVVIADVMGEPCYFRPPLELANGLSHFGLTSLCSANREVARQPGRQAQAGASKPARQPIWQTI